MKKQKLSKNDIASITGGVGSVRDAVLNGNGSKFTPTSNNGDIGEGSSAINNLNTPNPANHK